jgi:5'-nucleotidase
MPLSPRRLLARTAVTALTLGLAAAPLVATGSAVAAPDGSGVVINEAYLSGGSANAPYTHKFVELYNPTDAPVSLEGWSVQYRSATGTAVFSLSVTLSGSITPGGHYLVAGGSNGSVGDALPTPDASGAGLNPSGTTGTLALVSDAERLTGAPADVLADDDLVDLLGYGGSNTFETALATPPPGNSTPVSLNRTDGVDTDDNAADFTLSPDVSPTPSGGTEPEEPEEPQEPVDVTIAEIQGSGDASPLDGRPVTTRGVVTATYPTGGLDGFYLQTAGTGGDLGAHTASHGVFVYTGDAPTVQIGDHVEVTGVVDEYFGLTQVAADDDDSVVLVLEPAAAVKPATVAYPRTDAERELLEGMLIDPQGDFTLTDNYNAGNSNFGELGLASGSTPLYQPTELARPGTPEAAAVAAENAARAVLLDDGATVNFLGSDAAQDLPRPWFTGPDDQVRVGAAVDFVEPVVLSYGFDAWRFQPTTQVVGDTHSPVTFERTRTQAPEPVGGQVSLASFNVLNYFTHLGEDEPGCASFDDRDGNPIVTDFCDVRGAYSQASFERQQAKIVAAINALDADVVSLEEIENSAAFGADRDESLAALVEALNADAGTQRWAYVASPAAVPVGEDVIRTAFIYQPAAVEPVGGSTILDHPAFANARQPLAQAFAPVGGSERETFVAIANHFKSKGSPSGATGDNVDTGDGQGAWNGDRVRQAEALVAFADAQAAAAGTEAVFLLGDFNAYTQEDPLQVLVQAGYVDLGEATGEETYLFDGLVGSLDHVLASASAAEHVTGADIWNINSVEPVAYEYSRYNYNATLLYAPDPYRASDHDPIIVGMDLDPEPARAVSQTSATVLNKVVERRTPAVIRIRVATPDTPGEPSGTVLVTDADGDVIGLGLVHRGKGVALTSVFRGAGTHTVTVTYTGNRSVAPSSTTLRIAVRRR